MVMCSFEVQQLGMNETMHATEENGYFQRPYYRRQSDSMQNLLKKLFAELKWKNLRVKVTIKSTCCSPTGQIVMVRWTQRQWRSTVCVHGKFAI